MGGPAAAGVDTQTMNVPLLDLKAQLATIRPELLATLEEVLDSTRYIQGPKVEQLEQAVADYVGAAHAVGLSSGTDALLAALMALEIGPGDIVLTTTYSFFATAGSISRVGATPALVDIDPDTYNISVAGLRNWFDQNADQAKRVKAIMPVHLYGQAADMDPILAMAAERNLAVIEDAAQAIGTKYPGQAGVKRVGALGTVGCFSFFPSKNLGAMGDGGMAVTNDADLAERLRILRNHGATQRYYHKIIGGNFRLDAIQAAVLIVKMPHLEDWHTARRANAQRYDELFADVPTVTPPALRYDREHHIYNQYIISVERDRDELQQHLQQANIGNAIYYPVPFHEQECFAQLGYRSGQFPHSEYAAKHTLALPVYPELDEHMQRYTVQQIARFFG